MPENTHEFYGIQFDPFNAKTKKLFRCGGCRCLVEFEDIISHARLHKYWEELEGRVRNLEEFVGALDETVVPFNDRAAD